MMSSITVKILAVVGAIAVIGIIGLSAVAAEGGSFSSALSEGMMAGHGNGDCNRTQDMVHKQLCDGSCQECMTLAGEGDMAQSQQQMSYQYMHSNQNGCDNVEIMGGDQVQNQNEWSWQYEWAHQYGDEEIVTDA